MSTLNTSTTKQPFRLIEIPLRKFTDEAIPHHKQIFECYKNTVHKYISLSDYKQLEREIHDKKRTIQQLRNLMYELDTLRTQVQDSDLDKFDSVTLSLRKTILSLLSDYTDLEKAALSVISAYNNQNIDVETHYYENPLAGASQIQLQEDIDELKLKERQQTLQKVEAIHKDIEDLHGLYTNFSELVHQQGEQVNQVESNVEGSNQSIAEGLKHIIKAANLSRSTYPITGALLGGIIGGPIGLLGGLKIGGLAAVGCGLAGYTGGKFVKKIKEKEVTESRVDITENKENEPQNFVNKKDI